MLITSRTKYTTELAALQSIDIEKIMPFIDSESAQALTKEPPFINAGIKSQVINAFIAQQDKLNINIAKQFEDLIAGSLIVDTELSSGLEFVKKLLPASFGESELIQNNLVELFKNKTNDIKEVVLDLINKFQNYTKPTTIKSIEEELINIISTHNIADQLFMAGLIPLKINSKNFDLGKIVEVYIENSKKTTHPELEQLVNVLFSPDTKKELGDKLVQFIENLAEQLISSDETRRSYILSKLDEFIKASDLLVSSSNARKNILKGLKNVQDKITDENNKALLDQLVQLLEPKKKEKKKTKWIPI